MGSILTVLVIIYLKFVNAPDTGNGMLQIFIRHMERIVAVDLDSTATVRDIRQAARIHFEALQTIPFALSHGGRELIDESELLSDLGIGQEHVIDTTAIVPDVDCGCARVKLKAYDHRCTWLCERIGCNKSCGLPGNKASEDLDAEHKKNQMQYQELLRMRRRRFRAAAAAFPRIIAPPIPKVAPKIENDTIRNTQDLNAHFSTDQIEQIVEYAETIEDDLRKDVCFLIADEGSKDYNYVSRDKRGCYRYYKGRPPARVFTRYRFVGYYNLKAEM